MTPEQRKIEEEQIKNSFSELQKKLEDLRNEVQTEDDDSKKQEKNDEIQKLEKELSEMKSLIDTLSFLQETDLQSLKTKLESLKTAIQSFKWEVVDLQEEIRESADKQNEKSATPTTYELLKDSETYNRLLNIISSNQSKFKNLKKDEEGNKLDTPEKKLEYIFKKIRKSLTLFLKNKLWDSENTEKVINNTIAPAFEWNLMELLRDQWNETNVGMLEWVNKISWKSLKSLFDWVKWFADKFEDSYSKFNQWMNAVDYLSVHNWVLRNPDKSEVLANPLKFQEYMNDAKFSANNFSPYVNISENIFKVDENQTFEFGISRKNKSNQPQWQKSDEEIILERIWNIQVVNNPRTTSLIVWLLDKPEKFFKATSWLQDTANHLLDSVNSVNSITKILGIDIFWEIKSWEKSLAFRVLDFICKLIWITWWLDWIIKKWRMDRMNLTDDKNENISQIFKKYKESAWDNTSLSITDENSCKTALNDFAVTDAQKTSSTKGDFLRDSIAENMNVSLISPAIVQQAIKQQIIWSDCINREIITVKWKQQEKITIDSSKFTPDSKKALAHYHLTNMKKHLENYNQNDLKDFYTNIHSTEDIALCMTASLYVNHDDVIEWVKAKVFLPENYGSVRTDGTVVENWWRNNLDSTESSNKQVVTEQWIYDKAREYWITDNRQIAYVLSTINWESWFKNQKENWWENKSYWKVDATTWKAYYGRWFIQITHKSNYQAYSQIIKDSWKDFKDNNGNVIKWSEIDLIKNPDIILQSNDLAAFIAIDWMKNGWPNRQKTKRLDYYINDNKQDYYNARIIINWMSSKPQEYADRAQAYLDKLWKWPQNSPRESNESLIWPKLLAHNKDEIGWLGDSIMKWFGSEFQNMDGEVWKNTRNHPVVKDLSDEQIKQKFKQYKSDHPNIKSFMFYFWANNNNNQQTLSDIKKRSEWLESGWIQPVLCTCVWENSEKTPWLKELNQQLIGLWKEKSWPVVDFAKSNNNWDIKLSSDWVHPKSYSPMTNIVNSLLQA